MKIDEAFPSKYIKSGDLQGHEPTLLISDCQMADLGDEHKPVLMFQGKQKGMVLNRTNATVLADAYGGDTDAWRGKPVQLFVEKVFYQGQMKDGLRVRVPAAPMSEPAPAPAPQPTAAAIDDDLPF